MRDTRRTRLLLSAALFVALALIAVDYHNGSSPIIRTAKSVAGSAFGTAERAVATVTRPIGRFFGSGLSGSSGNGQVAALQRQLATLRAELSQSKVDRAQYAELGRMLRLAGQGGYKVVAASVVAFGQGYQQTVTVNAGSAEGIRPQQTVLDGDGLVGQVLSVTSGTATVLLADDPSSVVGVRLAPSGQIGWVSGQGAAGPAGGLLKLQVLSTSTVLTPGEQLVTAASVHDQPFVPGVPVGVVASVRNRAGALTSQAVVRPYAALTALDVVGIVISPPRQDPRFSVLPPRPRPGH